MIDTHLKDGTRLLDWRTPESLAAWVPKARAAGLMVGLAGALRPDDVAGLAMADPDVIGFRGAACHAGRLGAVSSERVALLRSCIDAASRRLVGGSAYSANTLGEKPDSAADLKRWVSDKSL